MRRARQLRAVAAAALLVCVSAIAAAGSPGAARTHSGSSYGWPVKPFDEAHPIRGTFGEPRVTFYGPPLVSTLLRGDGSFSYHTGIDIVAPDGTAVYPVESGVARLLGPRIVGVDSGNGLFFQYWHIVPDVSNGEHVVAQQTVLGHIRPSYGHVHLAEFEDGRPVNPLAPGNLGPYDDTTRPRVGAFVFRTLSGKDELPELIRGSVVIAVEASDTSALPVTGNWNGFPIAPALVTWRIERARDHSVVMKDRVAFDVRSRLPAIPFWESYARGTYQNMPTFKKHRYWRQPGRYLFRLTPTSFDTRRLHDGIYRLVVTAVDSRGNRGYGQQVFTVWNKPGWPPPTNQS